MSRVPAPPEQPFDGPAVVRLLDELLFRAIEARASDVHLEPKHDRLVVRYRIDGVMVSQPPQPLNMAAQVTSRIKVLSGMDIAERRQPQDGTFSVDLGEQGRVAVRASTFPAVQGETAVLRLMRGSTVMTLDQLGMGPDQVLQMRRFARHQGGLLLVTGPTGSGKTSTLYALLAELDTDSRNVLTLEDPVEVRFTAITQGQVNPKSGFTFSTGLRAILRQDPDVILVGEMRDLETTRIAVQASLTGHLVISSMHTNSTTETITRLIDIGLEPYIVANALVGVVAQRLVRTVCPHCCRPVLGRHPLLADLGYDPPPPLALVDARGCTQCHHTGYRGRTGIFEIVDVDDDLRALVKQKSAGRELKALLESKGVSTLRRSGVYLAGQGRTTLEEVLRQG